MGDSHRQSIAPRLGADANISVDVDGLECYRAIHGLPTRRGDGDGDGGPDPLWTVGIARAQKLFSEFDLKATFFVVGRDLEVEAHCDLARGLVEGGHELANHTYDHNYDLRRETSVEIWHQIYATDQIIEDVTGERPLGFRTPGYNVSADLIAYSRRAGHRYDASIFSCPSYWAAKAAVMAWRGMRGQRSGSRRTDLRTLLAPKRPYFPDAMQFWKEAPTAIPYVEIPMTVVAAGLFPVIGTSLHLLDMAGWERIWPLIDKSAGPFLSLEFHALDFVDASDLVGVDDAEELVARQPDLKIDINEKTRLYRRVLHSICTSRKAATLAEATASLPKIVRHRG